MSTEQEREADALLGPRDQEASVTVDDATVPMEESGDGGVGEEGGVMVGSGGDHSAGALVHLSDAEAQDGSDDGGGAVEGMSSGTSTKRVYRRSTHRDRRFQPYGTSRGRALLPTPGRGGGQGDGDRGRGGRGGRGGPIYNFNFTGFNGHIDIIFQGQPPGGNNDQGF